MTLPNEIQKKVDQLDSLIDNVRAMATDIRDDIEIDELEFDERDDLVNDLEEVEINCDQSAFSIEAYLSRD
jgi:hypothetical protein|tara:strand:+ start:202 stop:414 length:213 start_codon:yes stop_codon:yes gene_type:complete